MKESLVIHHCVRSPYLNVESTRYLKFMFKIERQYIYFRIYFNKSFGSEIKLNLKK